MVRSEILQSTILSPHSTKLRGDPIVLLKFLVFEYGFGLRVKKLEILYTALLHLIIKSY